MKSGNHPLHSDESQVAQAQSPGSSVNTEQLCYRKLRLAISALIIAFQVRPQPTAHMGDVELTVRDSASGANEDVESRLLSDDPPNDPLNDIVHAFKKLEALPGFNITKLESLAMGLAKEPWTYTATCYERGHIEYQFVPASFALLQLDNQSFLEKNYAQKHQALAEFKKACDELTCAQANALYWRLKEAKFLTSSIFQQGTEGKTTPSLKPLQLQPEITPTKLGPQHEMRNVFFSILLMPIAPAISLLWMSSMLSQQATAVGEYDSTIVWLDPEHRVKYDNYQASQAVHQKFTSILFRLALVFSAVMTIPLAAVPDKEEYWFSVSIPAGIVAGLVCALFMAIYVMSVNKLVAEVKQAKQDEFELAEIYKEKCKSISEPERLTMKEGTSVATTRCVRLWCEYEKVKESAVALNPPAQKEMLPL